MKKEFTMFKKWFHPEPPIRKKGATPSLETIDEIEESLWEIKEEFDFPTEEIENVVHTKRRNFDFMREMYKMHCKISKKEKYE
jgi:hypothetical protein